ncbi:hypothetical protein F8M41_011504 [Gigaspora margarita]|uniref:(d)CMP kinase n=1 Tax=Gigaspora margarita TaxID=4874 RepID=A0A8H3X105_GIGMA|nr:hypothetical protein F8M41_011504 [Gigaspora margarita]
MNQNQNYNYPIHYNHIIYESNNDDDSDYISADEESTNQHDNYILITKFLHDNNINPQQFYLKFNEIDSINMVHKYEHPLNDRLEFSLCNSKHEYQKKGFNIAIDGLSVVSKSLIGCQVAKWLNFTFIDSGLFYRYIANQFYLDDMIQLNEICLFKNEMIEKFQIGQKASEISNVPEIRNIINEIIQTITKNGGYVVVGRAKQLNAKEFEAIGKVFSDLLKRDVDSFDLVLEAKKVATIINTSDLSIEQVVARIL